MHDNDLQFLYGIHPIVEKLRAAPDEVIEIILADEAAGKAAQELRQLANQLGLAVLVKPRGVLDRLARGQRHQGAVAKINPYDYGLVSELLNEVAPAQWSGCVVVLDGITDPHNFGAILRTAEAVGVQHILIPKDRSVGVTPTVTKTSAGAVHHLRVFQATNLRRALEQLKKQGFWVVGLSAEAQEGVFDRTYPSKVCLVLGSEGEGIRPLIRRECDFEVAIPMVGKTASLNVSVAAGVFFYELLRQKRIPALAQGATEPASTRP